MPTISQFYGIQIIMRYSERHGPHFHAEYADAEALVSILDGNVLGGKLSSRAYRLVLDWSQLHRNELMENWERARRHQTLKNIEGLE